MLNVFEPGRGPAGFSKVTAAPAPIDYGAYDDDGRAARHGVKPAGGLHSFARDQEIFCEGEPAGFVHDVVSGAVRTFRLLGDGRRQIDAFHLPGDLFGIETGAEHRFSAEAIGPVTLRLLRCRNLESLAATDPAFAVRLVAGLTQTLKRAQDHMLLLGRKNAREKIASFLLGLSRRVATRNCIDLPMSRYDIADHLGLTIETVSRTLTQLQRDHVIEFPEGRRVVVLCNPAALHRLEAGDEPQAFPGRQVRLLPRFCDKAMV